jgi:hypothetical protein
MPDGAVPENSENTEINTVPDEFVADQSFEIKQDVVAVDATPEAVEQFEAKVSAMANGTDESSGISDSNATLPAVDETSPEGSEQADSSFSTTEYNVANELVMETIDNFLTEDMRRLSEQVESLLEISEEPVESSLYDTETPDVDNEEYDDSAVDPSVATEYFEVSEHPYDEADYQIFESSDCPFEEEDIQVVPAIKRKADQVCETNKMDMPIASQPEKCLEPEAESEGTVEDSSDTAVSLSVSGPKLSKLIDIRFSGSDNPFQVQKYDESSLFSTIT